MNKVFKKVAALGLAAATILSMTFTASAIPVTDKNDDGNFAYSSQYNSKAFGYVWNTAAIQALYPEFTKSYLSTPRTYISSKTHGNRTMVAMLDKSITTWEDAKNYVKNLTVKDKNGKVLLCKVERDSATGRFGLRAMDISQVEYKIKTETTYRTNTSTKKIEQAVELTYTLKGLWVGAPFSVYVLDKDTNTLNATFTGGGEGYITYNYNGFDKPDWYTYYKFESKEAYKTGTKTYTLGKAKPTEYQTYTFDAILDKDGKQRNLVRTTYKRTVVEHVGYVGLEGYSYDDGKVKTKTIDRDTIINDKFYLYKDGAQKGNVLYVYIGKGLGVMHSEKYVNDAYAYADKRNGMLDGYDYVRYYIEADAWKNTNGKWYIDEGSYYYQFKVSDIH